VRSLASHGLSARTVVRRHIPGHPGRNPSGIQGLFCLLFPGLAGVRIRPGDPAMRYCLGGAWAWL